MGEETEFAEDSYYGEKLVSGDAWQKEWRSFENSLKTEARFFNHIAISHLASVFDGIDELCTHDGRPLVVDAGPGTDFHTLFRARVFQSDAKLKEALCRPDQQLGPPPALLATAGRMNAQGISVFYGANDPKAAIAEVRPPVGSKVAVAQFEIIRKLRLLKLTAFKDVRVTGSIFDIGFASRLERAEFLQALSKRITQPVMPDDEPFEYLATQAIADYLATGSLLSIDGILFPSAQLADDVLNVVLFHKSAGIEAMDIPKGTKITASLQGFTECGYAIDYSVLEELPPTRMKTGKFDKDQELPNFDAISNMLWDVLDANQHEATLRILSDSVKVHHVRGVEYSTCEFPVRRHRPVKSKDEF